MVGVRRTSMRRGRPESEPDQHACNGNSQYGGLGKTVVLPHMRILQSSILHVLSRDAGSGRQKNGWEEQPIAVDPTLDVSSQRNDCSTLWEGCRNQSTDS